MRMREIDNENATKAYATRGDVYTIHTNKYTEHVPSKPTTTSMREKGINKYTKAQTAMCSEFTSNNSSGEGENQNLLLQEYSLELEFWTIKGQYQAGNDF